MNESTSEAEFALGNTLIYLLKPADIVLQHLLDQCLSLGLRVSIFEQPEAMLKAVKKQPPALSLCYANNYAEDLGLQAQLQELRQACRESCAVVALCAEDTRSRLAICQAGFDWILAIDASIWELNECLSYCRSSVSTKNSTIVFVSPQELTDELNILGNTGYTLSSQRSVHTLFEHMQQCSADLLIVDLSLGIEDAHNVVAAIGQHSRYKTLPLILLATAEELQAYLQHQGTITVPVIQRPTTAKLLLSQVHTAISQGRQRALERSLAGNEKRLRLATEFAQIGIMDWDVRKNSATWSEQAAKILGISQQELNDLHYEELLELVHPEDQPRLSSAIIDAVKINGGFDLELRIIRADQNYAWVRAQGHVSQRAGATAEQVLGVVVDISERKLAEQQLALFKLVIEAADFGISLLDEQGRFIYCNDCMVDMSGFSRDTLYGGISLTMADLINSSNKDVTETLQNNKIWHDLVTLKQQDGEEYFANISVGAITERTQLGQARYFMIVSDYSEELGRQLELSQARDEAENANRAKTEFLSNMSHELRTPLNAILGFSQIMEIDDNLTETQRDNFNEIKGAGEHLLSLINEILDLTKIESGSITLSIETLPFIDLVQECQVLVNPLAEERGITFRSENTDVRLNVDRVRLKQVMINLLSNAVKYNRDQGTIVVRTMPSRAGYTRIEVEDTGQGIAQEDLGKIFKPFERLGLDSDGIEGTGIGLMITRRLVEVMGGQIGVSSELGSGSTFWIELPTSKFGESELFLPEGNLRAHTRYLNTDQKKVLYIEDSSVNLALVKQILSSRPYIDFIGVETAEQGLELIAQHQPDIILLDINLPQMDGFEVLKRLRSADTSKTTPVVAVTANAMPEEQARGEAAGFNAYLTKPLDVVRFLEIVDTLLQ